MFTILVNEEKFRKNHYPLENQLLIKENKQKTMKFLTQKKKLQKEAQDGKKVLAKKRFQKKRHNLK